MIRLRKILLCNYPFYILLFCSLVFVLIKINVGYESIYKGDDKYVTGYLENYYIDGNRLTITLDSREKIIGNYYFDTEEELSLFKKLFSLGDYVRLEGVFYKVNNNTTKGMFNYRKYLERKGVFYNIKIDNIELIKKNKNIYYHVKNYIIKRINNNSYLYTFILGDTTYIDSNVLSSYRENGISHLFAISGMHISLLSSILLKILKKIRIPSNTRYFITNLFLIGYLFLTGFSPSILRGVLFFLFFSINKIYYFYIKSVNIFIFVLSIVLLINPFYIYDVGFLYSFIISFSYIVLGSYMNKFSNYVFKLFISSFVAFIVSFPITIYYFYQVNLLSILYNLFYVPFISIIVFPFALITFIFTIFIPIFNILIFILEKSSIFLSNIDICKFIFMKINSWFYILYFVFIILFFLGLINRKFYLIVSFFIMMIVHYFFPYFDSSDYIKMIDIGQGDSILIHSNNKSMLIDTGGKMSYSTEEWTKGNRNNSIVGNLTIPLLKSLGIKKLDYLILTHGDYDHMGEAINLVNNYKVEKAILNPGKLNYLEKEFINSFDNYEIVYDGYQFELGDFSFLSINSDLGDENDSSIVLYSVIDKYKLLFMGDASTKSELNIMNKYNLGEIDILKVGHHGSKTSSGKKFIEEINPKFSLISVGKDNKFGHPNNEVLENLEDSKIYRTDIDGSVMFKFKYSKLQIETCIP